MLGDFSVNLKALPHDFNLMNRYSRQQQIKFDNGFCVRFRDVKKCRCQLSENQRMNDHHR